MRAGLPALAGSNMAHCNLANMSYLPCAHFTAEKCGRFDGHVLCAAHQPHLLDCPKCLHHGTFLALPVAVKGRQHCRVRALGDVELHPPAVSHQRHQSSGLEPKDRHSSSYAPAQHLLILA